MNIEKISVKGYYVWVDKDATLNCSVGERNGFQYDYRYDVYYYKSYKIVAASNELNLNISALNKVPTYVEWLAEQHQKGGYDWQKEKRYSFIKGYETAEQELYTEDDVRKAIEMATTSKYDHKLEFYSEEQIIEQLKSNK